MRSTGSGSSGARCSFVTGSGADQEFERADRNVVEFLAGGIWRGCMTRVGIGANGSTIGGVREPTAFGTHGLLGLQGLTQGRALARILAWRARSSRQA